MFFHAFFFFNDTATTEIYTLSLHDALPISVKRGVAREGADAQGAVLGVQKVQLGDAVEVEQPRRPREAKVHHRHQALAAGEDLALLAMLRKQCEQGIERLRGVVFEVGGLHFHFTRARSADWT